MSAGLKTKVADTPKRRADDGTLQFESLVTHVAERLELFAIVTLAQEHRYANKPAEFSRAANVACQEHARRIVSAVLALSREHRS